jgi:hypothetical protein
VRVAWKIAASEVVRCRSARIELCHLMIALCAQCDITRTRLAALGVAAADAILVEGAEAKAMLDGLGLEPVRLRRRIRALATDRRDAGGAVDGVVHRGLAARQAFDRAARQAQDEAPGAVPTAVYLLEAVLQRPDVPMAAGSSPRRPASRPPASGPTSRGRGPGARAGRAG